MIDPGPHRRPPPPQWQRSIAGAVTILGIVAVSGCATLRLIPERRQILCDKDRRAECGAVAYIGGLSNAVTVDTGDGTLLFDTKMSAWARRLAQRLAADPKRPVRWIGITHPHCDHLAGLIQYRNSPALREIWAADTVKEIIGLPNVVGYAHDGERKVGAVTVEILRFPHAHTGGDLAFWMPSRRLLVSGDIFQCGYYPHAEKPDGGSYLGLLAAARRLAALRPKPEVIVGGHGEPCTYDDLARYVEYLTAVIERGEHVSSPELHPIYSITSADRLWECSQAERQTPGGWNDPIHPRCVRAESPNCSAACLGCRKRQDCAADTGSAQ